MSEQKHPCMIICAGTSRRFGEDKILAHLAGRPVLSYVIERLLPQVQTLAVNASDEGAYSPFGLPIIPDSLGGSLGPLAGVLTAMEWAKSLGESRVLTCAGDTPFITHDWAQRLSDVPANTVGVSFSGERVHNVCALWPVGLSGVLRSALEGGQRRAGEWIGQQKFSHIAFDISGEFDPFFNINTQADMDKAERMAARLPAGH